MPFTLPRLPRPLIHAAAPISLFALPLPAPSGAATLFSNLGPDDFVDNTRSPGLLGPDRDASDSNTVAVSFMVGPVAQLWTSAELPLALDAGLNSLTVSLATDAGGLPGAMLSSVTRLGRYRRTISTPTSRRW